MDEHSLESHFTGFTDIDHMEQPHMLDSNHFLNDQQNNTLDLNALIEQSLTPLSVGNIINTMNQNNSFLHQQYEQYDNHQQQQLSQPTMTTLNHLNMYQLSGNMNIGGMPVIIVNLPHQAVVSPATPSAEMSHMNIHEQVQPQQQQPIAGIHNNISRIQQDEEPPFKKRRPSVVEENDMDLMALSHQMDLLRRNSLPVLHSIHVPPRQTLQPSVSVDELLSPSKFIRDDIDLLDDYGSGGGEVISLLNEDEEDGEQPDSPPHNITHNPFNFGNFYTSAPPAKNEQNFNSGLQPLQIPTGQSQPSEVQTAPTPTTDQPKKNRRRKSTPGGDTPNTTPGTPVDGRKLVCLGKRPRKNKKTQPEDQYLMKFTMRRNK